MPPKKIASEDPGDWSASVQAVSAFSGNGDAYWLAVEVSGRGFLFPLSQAGQIFPWFDPQPIPYTKAWFLGVANLRGALCGVVSLAKYFHLEPGNVKTSKTQGSMHDRRLVGFHPDLDLNTVLVVDKLIGLKSQDQMHATSKANQYRDLEGAVWQEADLYLLAKNPTFMSIAQ